MAQIRIMTFNVRGAFEEDGINIWQNRAALNAETLQGCAPDVIGFQEVQGDNLVTFRSELKGYTYDIGLVSNRPDRLLFNAIFWRPEVVKRTPVGGFYLSRTPDRWSKDWDAGRVRVANWIIFRVIDTDVEFLHVNTHLDHIGKEPRLEGSRVILQQLQQIRRDGMPCLLTGDFNSSPELSSANHSGRTATAYGLYHEGGFLDAFQIAGTADNGPENTFHGYEGERFRLRDNGATWRIEWILALPGSRALSARSYAVVRTAAPPIYPSDHYPVVVDLEIE